MEMITTALLAALGKMAEPAVRDSYAAFKSLLARKFGAQSEVVTAVTKVEDKPDSVGRRETLREEVAAAGLENDTEIVQAATELLEKLKALAGGEQSIQQTVKGNHNIFSGTGDVNVQIHPGTRRSP